MTEQTQEPQVETAAQDPEALRQEWVRTQFQKANRFLAEKGILPGKVLIDESRYLVPYVAVWKMEAQKPAKQTYWVMSGDLPTDYVDVKVAQTARDALKHFSMMWQLKAENLIQSGAVQDPTQAKFANMLISRAQSLYQIQQDDKLWG
ncbi:DUF4826 domain-containing protein [Shewanella amazonensis]|uniref:DUF4826 domain-containing protein n=1 Tax=Shewanella amazonensis (strain ATCC BAA-1098 / SB2B) TaxID=326297 RepID=A1S7B5_SHEAM|nr:DUF4826 family protein [Shewanella amazonensis]ABM00272.1 conserved hypothetical protein [Shewanella amazonensis SB2B]